MIICTDPAGCHCTAACEFPCWQRVGLTDRPCCDGCAPLPALPSEDPDDQVPPLHEFTITALADWVMEPVDEDEGRARAIRATELARQRGSISELLRAITERSEEKVA